MKIVVCTGEINKFASSHNAIRSLRKLGHTVITVGGFEGADIPILPKCNWPKRYDYNELKMLVGDRWKDIDLILQLEPGFWLTGENRTGVPSTAWVSDIHRGGRPFRDLIVEGNFNYVFVSFKYYFPHFKIKGIFPYWLPFGYDTERVKDYNITPECDIAFVCESGINEEDLKEPTFDTNDSLNLYYKNVKDGYRYSSEYEYQERAELIYRLSKDFHIRIYGKCWNDDYAKLIQKGKITFNRSGQYDTSFKNFELAGCKRLLLTNSVPHLDTLFPHDSVLYYNPYYTHKLPHLFDLDYEQVKSKVEFMLGNEKLRLWRAAKLYHWVKEHHSMESRMLKLIDVVGGNTTFKKEQWN